jgi:hypothetical protein
MARPRKPRKPPPTKKLIRKRRKSEPPIPSDPVELAQAGEELARAITDILSIFVPGAPEVKRHKRDISIRTAERFLKDHGLYSSRKKKLTKGRREYIKKVVRKNADILQYDERGIPKFLFAPAETKGQKTALKEAKKAGYRTTKKGVFVEREHSVAARIGYDPHFKKYFVEKIPRRRKKGEPPRPQERPRDYFAGFDELVTAEKKFRAQAKKLERSLKPGQQMRFVVYGRALSRSYFEDADSLLRGFTHYMSYNKNPYDFVTNLRIVIVDEDEDEDETYDRLFDPDTGKLKGYRGR